MSTATSAAPLLFQAELDEPYPLAAEAIARFCADGCITLGEVLPPAVLAHFRAVITPLCHRLATDTRPLAERGTYGKAFLQAMNLWRHDAEARRFVFGRRLARIAAELLEVAGVRLYHDQALYKEAGGGFTPWHVDQHYWPLASDRTVTAWIPFQATPLEMGPLEFAPGSQRILDDRELGISDTSEQRIARSLRDIPKRVAPYALGEVSFHLGWHFHRAGPNTTDRPREVMTVIYMDAAMRLAQPANRDQECDHRTWCPGVAVGSVVDSPLNPVLWGETVAGR
jgi:ectoine hydroxylase-related dioxygenase (phytanoyl-CoA dioxygenase family)